MSEISDTHRETGRAGSAYTVLLRRIYDAPIEDVWDACTNPERINRWFVPVSGDLRLGGSYQLEGNAGGEIVACEPPRLLKVTWIYGEMPADDERSDVEVRLSPVDDDRTQFELEHVADVDPEMWGQFGPGAVGVGWDLGLVGLAWHLRGKTRGDPAELMKSPEMRALMTESSTAWGVAHAASGAPEEAVVAAVANTTAAYVPPLES
jgi:uncharacterized protein YndB with AHSA1/START domain